MSQDNKLSDLHDESRDDQRTLAQGNPAQNPLPEEKDNKVPNPVPANPQDKKTQDEIRNATPGNSLAQAVTTLNPVSRNQEPNLANDEKTRKDDVVNINGNNVKDPVAAAQNDSNFAKHNEEDATDEKNNPVVNPKADVGDNFGDTPEPVEVPELSDKEKAAVAVVGRVPVPEDTLLPTDLVPSAYDDYPEHGAVAHDSNDADKLIRESNDEDNNPIVQGKDHSDKKLKNELKRKKDETNAEHADRVGLNLPVADGPKFDYLGRKV